ncbi:hypothetical protein TH61_14240 [Rufibacter sp. DG15C]|nr:hypothetical protein TH61_14240 [Rufibacter sp. DG15C]
MNPVRELSFEDTTMTLKFEEFSVTINRFMVSDDYVDQSEKFRNVLDNDTIDVFTDFTETLEGQTVIIASNTLENIIIEQAFETSATIMDEGPHCDLLNWKHHKSPWDTLKANKQGYYIANKYTEADWERFPEVNLDELKAAVSKECGEEWVKHIKNVKSVKDYPSGVSLSHYLLRISGTHKTTGKSVSKLVRFEVPMGC